MVLFSICFPLIYSILSCHIKQFYNYTISPPTLARGKVVQTNVLDGCVLTSGLLARAQAVVTVQVALCHVRHVLTAAHLQV